MASHSLVAPHSPATFDATPESLLEQATELIREVESVVNKIALQTSPEDATYATAIQEFALMKNRFLQQSRVIKFYASTHPNQHLRKASTAATTLLNAAQFDIFLRKDFFERVAAIFTRDKSLPDAQAHYLEKIYTEFVLKGASITSEDERQRFKAIQKESTSSPLRFETTSTAKLRAFGLQGESWMDCRRTLLLIALFVSNCHQDKLTRSWAQRLRFGFE
jgi:Zn-dependent oligopeptidase